MGGVATLRMMLSALNPIKGWDGKARALLTGQIASLVTFKKNKLWYVTAV